jgi:molybdenum-dependent DNA-binding transcriptional regulator ModE
MKRAQPEREPIPWPADGAEAPQGLELRHLRHFVAVADAGSFTRAAERIFIAQTALSQQIRHLEQIVGTPLLHRRRDGLRLTTAGGVLLDASRTVLSLVDHEVSRTADLLFPLRRETNIGDRKLGSVMPLLTQRDWSSTWAKRTLPPIPDPNSQKRTAPGHSWPGPAGHRFVEGRHNVEAAGVEPTPHVGVGQEPAP